MGNQRKRATSDLSARTAARRLRQRGVKVSQETEKATGRRESTVGVTASQARRTKRKVKGVTTYGTPIK